MIRADQVVVGLSRRRALAAEMVPHAVEALPVAVSPGTKFVEPDAETIAPDDVLRPQPPAEQFPHVVASPMATSSAGNLPAPNAPNDPAVEAAFQAVPATMIAEILDGALHAPPAPPHTNTASLLGGELHAPSDATTAARWLVPPA